MIIFLLLKYYDLFHHLCHIVPARYSPVKLTGTSFDGSPFGPVPLMEQAKAYSYTATLCQALAFVKRGTVNHLPNYR